MKRNLTSVLKRGILFKLDNLDDSLYGVFLITHEGIEFPLAIRKSEMEVMRNRADDRIMDIIREQCKAESIEEYHRRGK